MELLSLLFKKNLSIHILEKHNHDLNFADWLIHKKWSEGFQQLFSAAKKILLGISENCGALLANNQTVKHRKILKKHGF